jgi:hypothetical protein
MVNKMSNNIQVVEALITLQKEIWDCEQDIYRTLGAAFHPFGWRHHQELYNSLHKKKHKELKELKDKKEELQAILIAQPEEL